LLAHGGESLIFERVLAYLRERGLVQASGRQRTDATHILGAVKQMSDVEVMRESVRLALSALVSADAKWLMRWIPASFTQNYCHAISNYRMSEQELAALIQQTGEEAHWLLDQVACQAEVQLQQLPEVVQLARIWDNQYHYVNESERTIPLVKAMTRSPSASAIRTILMWSMAPKGAARSVGWASSSMSPKRLKSRALSPM
jgi:transposase